MPMINSEAFTHLTFESYIEPFVPVTIQIFCVIN